MMKYSFKNGIIADHTQSPPQCAGFVIRSPEHGESYDPNRPVGVFTPAEVATHNHNLDTVVWQQMLQTGRGVIYTNGKEVRSFTGLHRVPLLRRRVSYHNLAGGAGRRDVWFVLDGNVWHGVNIGDQELCRVRRTKQTVRKANL